MKNKYLYILAISLFIFSFSYGYYVNKKKIFPYAILKDLFGTKTGSYIIIEKAKKKDWYKKMLRESVNKIIIINNYNNAYYIYNDRAYTNKLNDDKLIGKTLIQISRNKIDNLKIILSTDTFVYRVLCDKNDNKTYQDWITVNYNVEINGLSCAHKKVVKKYFSKGIVELNAGGPISSDPIFIETSNFSKVFIYNKK